MHPFYSSRWPRFMRLSRMALAVSMMLATFHLPGHQVLAQAQGKERPVKHPTFYRTIQVDGLSIFYREAGPKDAPTLLLLHWLPSSSRMFEPLFSRLSDLPGASGPDRGSNRSGRRFAQRRSGGELESAAGLLGRSRCQRGYASRKSAVAGDDADAARRNRSQRR